MTDELKSMLIDGHLPEAPTTSEIDKSKSETDLQKRKEYLKKQCKIQT
jgi:hypothetical protein